MSIIASNTIIVAFVHNTIADDIHILPLLHPTADLVVSLVHLYQTFVFDQFIRVVSMICVQHSERSTMMTQLKVHVSEMYHSMSNVI